MLFGVIHSYDKGSQTGQLLSSGSQLLNFAYGQGQNLMNEGNASTPAFTGRHEQPKGYSLKIPVPGELVIFESADGLLARWGYICHYQTLAIRRLESDTGQLVA